MTRSGEFIVQRAGWRRHFRDTRERCEAFVREHHDWFASETKSYFTGQWWRYFVRGVTHPHDAENNKLCMLAIAALIPGERWAGNFSAAHLSWLAQHDLGPEQTDAFFHLMPREIAEQIIRHDCMHATSGLGVTQEEEMEVQGALNGWLAWIYKLAMPWMIFRANHPAAAARGYLRGLVRYRSAALRSARSRASTARGPCRPTTSR